MWLACCYEITEICDLYAGTGGTRPIRMDVHENGITVSAGRSSRTASHTGNQNLVDVYIHRASCPYVIKEHVIYGSCGHGVSRSCVGRKPARTINTCLQRCSH